VTSTPLLGPAFVLKLSRTNFVMSLSASLTPSTD
jgi:hypothetical protein